MITVYLIVYLINLFNLFNPASTTLCLHLVLYSLEQNIQILFDYITFKMSWLPSAMQSYIKWYQWDWKNSLRYYSQYFINVYETGESDRFDFETSTQNRIWCKIFRAAWYLKLLTWLLSVKFGVEWNIYLSLTTNNIMTYKPIEGRLCKSGFREQKYHRRFL
jgi:hypothetical protein